VASVHSRAIPFTSPLPPTCMWRSQSQNRMHDVVLFAMDQAHAWYSEFSVSRVVGLGFAIGLNDHAVYVRIRVGPVSLTVGKRTPAH
jgi:hypothetical protein